MCRAIKTESSVKLHPVLHMPTLNEGITRSMLVSQVVGFTPGKSCDEVQCESKCGCNFNGSFDVCKLLLVHFESLFTMATASLRWKAVI